MPIVISIILLIAALMIGISVPMAFGFSIIYMVVTLSSPLSTVIPVGYSSLNSLVLLAIPMFVMAGGVIERGKIGNALVDFVELFVGKIRGGLGIVSVLACAVFGAISGSAAATLSCIGSIMFPKLRDKGYKKGPSAALVINAAPLGLLIPPSSLQILYAWSSGQSVLACFLSTIVPGLILATLLSLVNVWYSYKNPALADVESVTILSKEGLKRSRSAIPALLMPVIILGGIYGGIMTPTEAAAVAVLYALPVSIYFYRGMTWKQFKDVLIETGTTTGAVMGMLFFVMILSRFYVLEGLPKAMAGIITGFTDSKILILVMVNIFMIIIGMLMDDASGVLLCTPILLPLVKEIGVSPIQFAAILGVNLGMGNVTPPTAPLLYLGSRITNVPVGELLKPTVMMILFAWLPTLILTTYIPGISLFLPRLFGLA